MAELAEGIAASVGHTEENPDCPFCPPPKGQKFTTYPGKKAHSTQLTNIMLDPSILGGGSVAGDGSARPKEDAEQRQSPDDPKPKPTPLEHPTWGAYSYQAHHLIPGKQKIKKKGAETKGRKVMSGHKIEVWIKKGSMITEDTGYSINNCANGVWLAGPPEEVYVSGRGKTLEGKPAWRQPKKAVPGLDLTEDQKTEVALYAMNNGQGQFHYSQHSVDDDIHPTYPRVVEQRLSDLFDHIVSWQRACEAKTKKTKPFEANWKINGMLDLTSRWIKVDIRDMPPSSWYYFLCQWALDAHLAAGCDHDTESY